MRSLQLGLLVLNLALAAGAWQLHRGWNVEVAHMQQRYAAWGLRFEQVPSSWHRLHSDVVEAVIVLRAADSMITAMRSCFPGDEVPAHEGATYQYGAHRWVVRDGRWHRALRQDR